MNKLLQRNYISNYFEILVVVNWLSLVIMISELSLSKLMLPT